MRIILFFLFIALFQVYAIDSYSQESTISVTAANMKLGQFFKTIEKQSNFMFFYVDSDIEGIDVNVNVKEASVVAALNQALSKTGLAYEIHGQYITILPAQLVSKAQGILITGTITDQNNEPMPGVNVVLKGTTNGVVTDVSGKYTFTVPNRDAVLVFSFIGYQTREFSVGDQTMIDMTLAEDTRELEEVVVIGYGVLKKKLVTGATVQVSGETLQKQNTVSPIAALQSQSPGVAITKNSGQPGEDFKVYIRGMGTTGNAGPLYVVDGIPVGSINNINPSDIESIDILKDAASSAIYGSRAANGVVLVTTRQGKVGKPTIQYDGYYGVQNIAKTVTPLNAQQYAMIMDEARTNAGKTGYDFATLVPDWSKIQSGAWNGTNWIDEMTNKNAPIQNHALNITGGSEQSVYSIGLSYTSQEGVIGRPVSPEYSRITVRLNTDNRLIKGNSFDILKFGENFNYSYTEKNGIGIGDKYNNDINAAFKASPFLPMYDDSGNYHYAIPWNTVEANPIGVMDYVRGHNLGKGHNLNGNLYLNLQPIKDLMFRSSFGVKVSATSYRSYIPVYKLAQNTFANNDKTTQSQSVGLGWIFENTLNYRRLFNEKHRVDALIGFSMEKDGLGESINGSNANSNFSDFEHAYLSNSPTISSSLTSLGGGPWDKGSLMSGFGRVTYDYQEKYMATVVMRADGSSVFAPGKRWGYFPSVSAGWVITNEDFMEPVRDVISFFKLRASWGQNGNQSIAKFQYLAPILLNRMYFPGVDKSKSAIASYPSRLANPDVTWETSEQTDLGFDAQLFNQRLGVTFDWYNKMTKDWLLQAPALASYGALPPYINGGDVRNRGVELGLNWRDAAGDFMYRINASAAYNKNEVTKIANTEGIIHGPANVLAQQTEEIYRVQVGYPIGYFWGYKTDGIFQNDAEVQAYKNSKGELIQPNAKPGDVRFVNQDDNNLIDNKDKVMIGDPNPDLTFSFGFNLEFKGFDLSLSSYGSVGSQIMKSYRSFTDSPLQNYTTGILDRWHGEGTSNKIPRVLDGAHINTQYISDLHMENGSYWRISNVTFGYDFKHIMKQVPLAQMRLYVAVQNLFTVTKYTGMDPEVGFGQSIQWASGVDVGSYPSPRTFMFGLSITY